MPDELDIAGRILRENGYTGRGATLLALTLASVNHKYSAEALKKGGNPPDMFKIHRRQLEKALAGVDPERESHLHTARNPLFNNNEAWENGIDYMNHLFRGDVKELGKDAKLCYLLESLHTLAWWQVHPEKFDELFGSVKGEMEGMVSKLAGKSYEEAAKIASAFFASPTAKKIHESALVADKKYFNPSSRYGGGIDAILLTHQVASDPSRFMNTAHQFYKKAYGLDLKSRAPKRPVRAK